MTAFDITDMLAPKSDQLDAIELVSGPRTFTIEGVARNNSPEQPLNVSLVGFPRVWRPGLSMRRVLAAGWGQDASVYAGRSVTLYNDPEVTFGRDKTGGTRISHMSHLSKPLTVPLIVKRGQIKPFTVQPLKDAPAPAQQPAAPTAADVTATTDVDALKAMWKAASPDVRALIQDRVAELQTNGDDQ
jgi:hypothetical protein